MNVAIPLLNSSPDDYLELRYALRGIQAHVNPQKIYLIGGMPKWAKGIKNISFKDSGDAKTKEKNIFDKLLTVSDDEFLYCNDDHFLMRSWKDQYYYHETLQNKLYNLPRGSIYKYTIINTLRFCHKEKNYDVHCPMVLTKEGLLKLKKMPWGLDYGFCMKTLYAYINGISGVQYEDLKIRKGDKVPDEVIRSRRWFSTGDHILEGMLPLMDDIFKVKSKWEI